MRLSFGGMAAMRLPLDGMTGVPRRMAALVWEQRCPACFQPTDTREGSLFCAACLERLRHRSGVYCPHCGVLVGPQDAVPAPCGECLSARPPWRHFFLYGEYAGLLRDLILRCKLRGEPALAPRLGALLLGSLLAANIPAASPDAPALLIPIPLHPARLRERGFNQAVELARPLEAAALYGGARLVTDALIRTRNNPPQRGLSKEERGRNIQGIFRAAPAVHGKTILLLDDVLTTGATLYEAVTTLLDAGAAAVDVAVVARTMKT